MPKAMAEATDKAMAGVLGAAGRHHRPQTGKHRQNGL